MVNYICHICSKVFKQKGHLEVHKNRKLPCKKDNTIEELVEKKVQEALTKTNVTALKIECLKATNAISTDMNYTKKTISELKALCKERKIKGISGKSKNDLIAMLEPPKNIIVNTTEDIPKKEKNNLGLLEECLIKHSMQEVSAKLNLCIGTIRRWQELKDVPIQYTFDLYKLLEKEIDYSKFSSSSKDQFFTPSLISKRCWNTFKELVHIDIDKYTFIEPSAGDGSFMKILPSGSIGLDIEPRSENIQRQDYLSWKPSDLTKKYIVFGNPPFGLRGHLALNFINHSHEFADYVCFILPQLFESDGKGSPRKRVIGYNLIHSETLSAMFYSPDNQEVKVNGVFQIWSKFTKNPKYQLVKQSEEKMKVYSLSDGGTVASTRNKDMIGKCDIYLPSTCFGKENMRLYDTFDALPGKKGYGVVFFREKDAMISIAKKIDWSSVAFLSTNSAYNLRSSIVFGQFV
jgi:hypothetical protein